MKRLGIETVLDILEINEEDLEIIGRIKRLEKDRIIEDIGAHVRDICNYNVLTTRPLTEEEAADLFKKYGFPKPEFIDKTEGRLSIEFTVNHSRKYFLWMYYAG